MRLRVGIVIVASWCAGGCSLDWDRLDPRISEGAGGASAGIGGSGGEGVSAGGAGAGGVGGADGGGGAGGDPGPECGDGVLDAGENCDDGNTTPGDGCDGDCQVECDTMFDEDTLHCYAVFTTEVAEDEARAACESLGLGWSLAAVRDQAEVDYLAAQADIQDAFTGSPFIWLGGSDAAVEGTFVWDNGEPFPDDLWVPNQPDNNGDEDCVDLWLPTSGIVGINDDLCTRTFPYLCERPPPGSGR